ncbi:MAG TPA: 3-oxoacyl-[acyl-carrier-protein] synthase III C-terminal domain-containing protein [Candidatus Limnocylindrales bacterium]
MLDQVTTLQRVTASLPRTVISVEEAARSVGLNRFQARMFRRIHGLDQMASDFETDMFDMISVPARELLRTQPEVQSSIRYLVYAHTTSDLTPSFMPAAERFRDMLGLADADAFAVTHVNCGSGLEAVDIAGELLRAGGDPSARALLVVGEKPAAVANRLIVNVSLLGHAAAACLVGLDGRGGRVLSYAVRTAGQFADGLWLEPQLRAQFEDTYIKTVVEVIHEALAGAEMSPADLTMVVPHNVNVSSWLRLCRALGLDRDRVFLDNVPRCSHCYSTDLFLNLTTMRERGLLIEGGRYLLVTVGLGATYAAMVLEY